MVKNGRSMFHKCGNYSGCSCHNSKAVRRVSKKAAKAREARAWKKEAADG